VARDEETPESALARFEPGRSLPGHIAQNLQDLPGREIGVVTRGGLHRYIRDRASLRCRAVVKDLRLPDRTFHIL